MRSEADIALLSARHIGEVAELERLSFSAPWSENSLSMLTGEGGFGIVALDGGRVIAYGGMLCVLDEGQITNIATHPDFRRRGYASAVLTALCSEACLRGVKSIFLELRCSNEAAMALYRQHGFECAGVRKGFYSNPRENAYLMQKNFFEKGYF